MPDAPDLAEGDVVELTFHHTSLNLRPQECVRHWLLASLIPGGTMTSAAVAAQLSQVWSDNVLLLLPTVHTYDGATLRRVIPDHPDETVTTAGSGSGLRDSPPLPPCLSFCLVLRPTTAPPGVVGRMYIPSSTEDANNSSGHPSFGYGVDIAPLREFLVIQTPLVSGLSLFVATPVIWSRLHSDVYPVAAASRRVRWSQQRRRGGFWTPLPPI